MSGLQPGKLGARQSPRAHPAGVPEGCVEIPLGQAQQVVLVGCDPRVQLTVALDEIWRRVRRLNRYVEEQAPWQLAKDETRAGELDRVLGTLVEGLRVVSVLLHPYLPASTATLLQALGAPDVALVGARLGAGAVGRVAQIEPLFPKDLDAVEAA